MGSSGYNVHIKRICANPLDRLCDLLLDWDVMADLAKPPTGKPSADENSALEPVGEQLPAFFSCFHEYISRWEPLVIEEMKENVLSNFRSKTIQGVKKGYLQFSCTDVLPHAVLEIQCLVSAHKENEQDANA